MVIRHGRTDWSSQKRLQGRADLPLNDAGQSQVRNWRIDRHWQTATCLCSPLTRARETADILGLAAIVEPNLIEADWGEFEGRNLDELRADASIDMGSLEDRGIDFCPPGGESPRVVAKRIRPLFSLAATSPQVWITHKGIRNACLVLACGWDMKSEPPVRVGDDEALVLTISPDGQAHGAETLRLAAG